MKLVKLTIVFIFTFFSMFSQTNSIEKKADYYLKSFQFDSALVYTRKAILHTKDNNSFKKADFYLQYAKILKTVSKADSCFYYLDKAEKLYVQNISKNEDKLFYLLALKAEIARYLNQREQAIKLIYEASKKEKKYFNPDYLAYFRNRKMAILAGYYNNIPDSVVVIKKIAEKIISNQDKIKDKSIVAYTLNELGYLEFNKPNKKAIKYFEEAFEIAKKYNCKIALIDIAINIGRIEQQKNYNFKKSIYYHKIALKNAKDLQNYGQIKEAYLNLKICYSLAGDFETALLYGDSLAGSISQIYEKENALILKEIERKYNYEKKENELENTKKNGYYLIIILIGTLLSIGLLVYYNRKIKTNNKNLKALYEENEFLLSETNHRINNNLQLIVILISDELRKLNKEENSHIKKILSKVESIATLHRHLYQSKNKNEVEISSYLNEIQINFNELFKENDVNVIMNCDNKVMQIDQGMYLGLLLTELFINSLKHAFEITQNEKNILINFENNELGYNFYYKDNGTLLKGQVIQPKLVEKICRQLRVNYEIKTNNGFEIYLEKRIKNE